MDGQTRVVLYGDTVVLAGVGGVLATNPQLRVISIDPSLPTALGTLDSLRPCAVIVDLTVVSAESAVALVRGRPDLLLIGLEPGGESLVVLSGERARGLTTGDLAHLVETGVPFAGGANGWMAAGAARRISGSRKRLARKRALRLSDEQGEEQCPKRRVVATDEVP